GPTMWLCARSSTTPIRRQARSPATIRSSNSGSSARCTPSTGRGPVGRRCIRNGPLPDSGIVRHGFLPPLRGKVGFVRQSGVWSDSTVQRRVARRFEGSFPPLRGKVRMGGSTGDGIFVGPPSCPSPARGEGTFERNGRDTRAAQIAAQGREG